jgi:RNA polymerase sigma factor FliA
MPDRNTLADPDAAAEALAGLWRRFKEEADPQARERLIINYAPLVKFVAGRVGSGLPSSVDAGDLISYGIFGLMDALDKFDLERGIKFETYAIPRIRGAIVDELRALDWVPRSVRSKARNVERAIADLESRLHRAPTEEEIAAEMDIGVDDLRSILQRVNLSSVVALDEMVGRGDDDDGTSTLVDTIEDSEAPDPVAIFENSETKQILAGVVKELADRDQLIITMYYFEGLTLKEIGKALGVTESRVCQIHTKAMMDLRRRMKAAIAG